MRQRVKNTNKIDINQRCAHIQGEAMHSTVTLQSIWDFINNTNMQSNMSTFSEIGYG